MWYLQRIDPSLAILQEKYVAFVGAGGKTSFMEHIARRLLAAGKRVVVTTTTKIYALDPYILIDNKLSRRDWEEPFMRVGRSRQGDKLTGLSDEDLEQLGRYYDHVLVEADGARGLPLKFPAPHEPVVPSCAERVFLMAGLDALGGRVDQKVFRWELLRERFGIAGGERITPDIFTRFFSVSGLLKGLDGHEVIPVFNKIDCLSKRSEALDIARNVLRRTGFREAMVASVNLGVFYSLRQENEGGT